ncbi:MAG TPA: hypothetical protein VIL95_07455 [Bacillota bacterium]
MVIRLVDPTWQPDRRPFLRPERPASLHGRVVGLLGNGKPNSPVFLAFVGELLRQRYDAQVLAFDKAYTTMPAPPELLDEVAARCELAVTGVGD